MKKLLTILMFLICAAVPTAHADVTTVFTVKEFHIVTGSPGSIAVVYVWAAGYAPLQAGGCPTVNIAWITSDQVGYKEVVAGLMLVKALETPVRLFGDCTSNSFHLSSLDINP